MTRMEKLRRHCNIESGVGLEFGPLANPVVSKAESRVYYVDYTSTETLRKKSSSDSQVDIAGIVEIDINLENGELIDLARPLGPFDYIVASHVFEHIPDPIGWLNDLHALLAPAGVLVLAIPDKRYTFDYSRRLTSLADILSYHFDRLRRPSAGQLLDHYLNVRKVTPLETWDDSLNPAVLPERHHTDELALWLCRRALVDGAHVDCHCTVWEMEHFTALFSQLKAMGFVDFRMIELFEPVIYGNEFIVVLGREDRSAVSASVV